MTRQYFGTDGIRGRANVFPMTADMALKVAMATACVLRAHQGSEQQNRVVIGKDTRLSGYMLEQAMSAGFTAMGLEVILVGPIPTPAVAMLTRSLRCDLGVMISASHNPYQDNGIKIFGADGYKLADEVELEIEKMLDEDNFGPHLPPADKIGQAKRLDDATGRYVEYLKSAIPRARNLQGLKVVVDCAHGAAYKAAPELLWELEADVHIIGNKPNGKNINAGFGATATEALQKEVVETGADIGIALDGDADRLIVVDEKGTRIDGDQIMGLLALTGKHEGWLKGDCLVATVMSNLGLERTLAANDIHMKRTPVGDRYVVEAMREGGYNLGGEQSGHTVLSDFSTTGDGLLTALMVLLLVAEKGEPASKTLRVFEPLPQILKNVRFQGGKPLEAASVKDVISSAEQSLNGSGRILVRASGTEPVIRVMVEGDNQAQIENVANEICQAIEKAG
ncbi:MAG: phosphoglucosamine mutase [Pseudobdellovibrionaceae bacterium]